jgi:predicted DNA-binding ribbon-helix-helix protein
MTTPSTFCKEFDPQSKKADNSVMPGLRKRSVQLSGHATSIALEPEFWTVLEGMAKERRSSLAGLIASIDGARQGRPLASACRVAALLYNDQGKAT